MALLKQFCCCCTVKNGSIFCALYSMITSTIFIALLSTRYFLIPSIDASPAYSVTLFTTVSLYALKAVASVILLVGITQNKAVLLLPWIVMTVTCNIAGTAVLSWFMADNLAQWRDFLSWEAGILAYHICNGFILMYCLLCVISHLQVLISGKDSINTRRTRRQQRRHRELIQQFPFDPVWPGHVIGPPPYRENPPEYHCTSDKDPDTVQGNVYENKTGRYWSSGSGITTPPVATVDLSVRGQSPNISEGEQHSVHGMIYLKTGMAQCKALATVIAPSSFTLMGLPITTHNRQNRQLKRLPRHPSPVRSMSDREQQVAENEGQAPCPNDGTNVRESNNNRERLHRYPMY